MPWAVNGTQVPDGDELELWLGDDGWRSDEPLADAERLPGRYVALGLVDAHAHPFVGLESGELVVHNQVEAVAMLGEYAAGGVTAFRDAGSPMGIALDFHVPRGLPRSDPAGRFLVAERYPPALIGQPVPAGRLVEAGLAEIRRGARWVKVISDEAGSGDPEPIYDADTIRELVDASHAAGARVAVHCMTGFISDLVGTGIDSVEHGVAIGPDEISLMAEQGIAWTPTLSPYAGEVEALREHPRPRVAQMQRNVREMLPLAQRAGVRILAGTDLSGPLYGEVALLASYGLSPLEALRAATTSAYEFLGIEGAGYGERLNVVTYDDDPREDPAVLAHPAAVVIDGRRVR